MHAPQPCAVSYLSSQYTTVRFDVLCVRSPLYSLFDSCSSTPPPPHPYCPHFPYSLDNLPPFPSRVLEVGVNAVLLVLLIQPEHAPALPVIEHHEVFRVSIP